MCTGSKDSMHQCVLSVFRPAQPPPHRALSTHTHAPPTCTPLDSYTGLLHLVSFWSSSVELRLEIHPQLLHPSCIDPWGAGPILLLGSQNYRVIQVRRDLWRFLVQPSAQCRVCYEIRPGVSQLYWVLSWKIPRVETAKPLSNLFHHLTVLMVKKFLLIYILKLFFQFMSVVSCPPVMH